MWVCGITTSEHSKPLLHATTPSPPTAPVTLCQLCGSRVLSPRFPDWTPIGPHGIDNHGSGIGGGEGRGATVSKVIDAAVVEKPCQQWAHGLGGGVPCSRCQRRQEAEFLQISMLFSRGDGGWGQDGPGASELQGSNRLGGASGLTPVRPGNDCVCHLPAPTGGGVCDAAMESQWDEPSGPTTLHCPSLKFKSR